MTRRPRLERTGLLLIVTAAFFLWHLPLLTVHGRSRGWHSDSAIIGLMATRIFEGEGFDIFFWGQNYVGPLSSMFIAAWGFILGAVDALALRLGVLTEALLGFFLLWSAVSRVSTRAATVMLVALAITPPVILRMMIVPLGAEIGLFMSALLLAIAMQHVTKERGRGILATRWGQIAFGIAAGIGWWMNQLVVFTLGATAIILGLRSQAVRHVLRELRIKERFLLNQEALGWRPAPGVVEAIVWLSTRAGAVLLIAFVLLDLAGAPHLPFVFGPLVDPLLLLGVPHLILPFALGEIRFSRVRRFVIGAQRETGAILRFACGWLIGYAPVWLGGILGWYERTYVVGFSWSYPAGMAAQARELIDTIPHWIGMGGGAVGVIFAIAVFALAAFAVLHCRSEARRLLALIPLLNLLYFVAAHGATKGHYLITSVAPLFALAAVGAVDLWTARSRAARAAVVVIGTVALVSLTTAAAAMHRSVTEAPDPMPLLHRVRAEGCRICYADFWIAYRYRFLDGEKRAWIPYRSQNRTPKESLAMQKLPGQRCLIENDGTVVKLARDPQLFQPPPRSR